MKHNTSTKHPLLIWFVCTIITICYRILLHIIRQKPFVVNRVIAKLVLKYTYEYHIYRRYLKLFKYTEKTLNIIFEYVNENYN